jgi:hypothetical protein
MPSQPRLSARPTDGQRRPCGSQAENAPLGRVGDVERLLVDAELVLRRRGADEDQPQPGDGRPTARTNPEVAPLRQARRLEYALVGLGQPGDLPAVEVRDGHKLVVGADAERDGGRAVEPKVLEHGRDQVLRYALGRRREGDGVLDLPACVSERRKGMRCQPSIGDSSLCKDALPSLIGASTAMASGSSPYIASQ